MINKYLQIETLSIVFIGNFNPVIIQPYWLHEKGLIKEIEAKNAKITVMHPDLVRYEIDWVLIEITKERFELRTYQKPYFEPVKDLAINIFSILTETPIKSMGINHILEYDLNSSDRYYEFGNKLCPLSNWEQSLNEPRLLQLEMLEKERYDNLPGQRRVRIYPSDKIKHFGVSININDHFEIEHSNRGKMQEVIKLLSTNWEKSKADSRELIQKLWDNLNLTK